MNRPCQKRIFLSATAAAVALVSIGCGGSNHLSEYAFPNHGLAVVTWPLRPELLLASVSVRSGTPLAPTINTAGEALQARGDRARARLDSAASHLDMRRLLSGLLLERASVVLGAYPVRDPSAWRYALLFFLFKRSGGAGGPRPVQVGSPAEYVLVLDVSKLAVDAHEDGPARLQLEGRASLLDRSTGQEIWRANLTRRDSLTRSSPRGDGPDAVVRANAVYGLSVQGLEGVLREAASLTVEMVMDHLRQDLRNAREDSLTSPS